MADRAMNTGEVKEFLRFDITTDHSDHHYLNTNKPRKDGGHGGDSFTNGSSKLYKKILQEWKILEKDLPDTIIVRVYEQRIDLLRAAIVGAAGTPYHDGLFFFDVAFPSNYPNEPPKVYYHSFGFRINPNMYTNGRVCLSLLNTWTGKESEKWNPSTSTILQVLVSIQALVLNEKPYFNEPGLAGFRCKMAENGARRYNENAFVISCKTMLLLLQRPPKGFEDFVARHFRKRGNVVLGACNAYANGETRVGCYGEDGFGGSSSSSSSKSVVEVTGKFKGAMEMLYPQLFTAFTVTGASLWNFVEHLELNSRAQETERAKHGITKVIGKTMKIIGLNKGK